MGVGRSVPMHIPMCVMHVRRLQSQDEPHTGIAKRRTGKVKLDGRGSVTRKADFV